MKLFFAELSSTFLLVFLGTGYSVLGEVFALRQNKLSIALIWSLLIFLLITTYNKKAFIHMNPVVTLVLLLDKKIKATQAPLLWCGQFGGSLFASFVLKVIFPAHTGYGATVPLSSCMFTSITEIFLTFILIIVVLLTAEKNLYLSAASISLVVFVNILLGMGVSGASMNPARSFGPALVADKMQYYWIYLTMPMIGGILAWSIFTMLKAMKKQKSAKDQQIV